MADVSTTQQMNAAATAQPKQDPIPYLGCGYKPGAPTAQQLLDMHFKQ